MFYRIFNVEYAPGTTSQDIADYLESVREEYAASPGLVSNIAIGTSDTTGSAIVVYTSREASEANAEIANRVLGGLAQFLAAPPQLLEGDSFWELVNGASS